jgi:succinate dehydrogenase/fumarate reductase flavoprotein subunit
MGSIDELGEVITTDILVIGGGISGIEAAIKAKEKPVDVLVVDKGGIGWAGQVPITGGNCAAVRPEQAEDFFSALVEVGEYLNNQDWSYTYATEIYKSVVETAGLGAPFLKTPEGEVAILPFHKNFTATRYNPAKLMIKLKQAAVARGIRTLDKVFMVDLLQSNGKVVGAIGFGVVDGKTYIFRAKATIIACGGSQLKAHRHFAWNSGEGVAMAYRVGTQLMNAEFGGIGLYGFGFKLGGIRRRMPFYLFMENATGERFLGNYYPEFKTGQKAPEQFQELFFKISDAMAKEVKAGRGPIYVDFRKLTAEEKAIAFDRDEKIPIEMQPVGRGGDLLEYLRRRTGLDANKERVEIIPELESGIGTIRVGIDCKTTVSGLWAAGDACGLGSGLMGARELGTFPGIAMPWAILSGLRGGQSAGEYALASGEVTVDKIEVKNLKERMLKPLGQKGTVESHEVIYQIQKAVIPVKYYLHREGGRMKEALGLIEKAKESLVRVGAMDYHELMRCHQAKSMAFCAGWSLKAALMREESRGSHMREDYPKRNDKNWLKWIVIEQREGEDNFFTEPVPIEKYRMKPK